VQTTWLRLTHPEIEPDAAEVTMLRFVLMKPEHADVVAELAAVLREHLART
jgi:hypothetical protein